MRGYNMKRRFVLALIICLMVAMLTACGGKDEKIPGGNDDTHSGPATNGYAFKTKDGTDIVIDAEFEQFKKALGQEKSCFESPSCAFGDLDKIWNYGGFDVYTYQLDKIDYVSSVILKDDTVCTPEKVYIGDSADDVISAYGDPATQDSKQIVYEKDKMKLIFMLSNDTVTQIQYTTRKVEG